MRAELVVQMLVRALAEQVHVEIAERGGEPVGVLNVEAFARFLSPAVNTAACGAVSGPTKSPLGMLTFHRREQIAILIDQAHSTRSRLQAAHDPRFAFLVRPEQRRRGRGADPMRSRPTLRWFSGLVDPIEFSLGRRLPLPSQLKRIARAAPLHFSPTDALTLAVSASASATLATKRVSLSAWRPASENETCCVILNGIL